MSIPRQSGKFSLEELKQLELRDWTDGTRLSRADPGIYSWERAGIRYDMLWHPSTRHDARLFVLFSGDATRSKYNPPVFQRFTWAPFFPGHVLFVSDPSLHLDEGLGLAWYAGTTDYDPLPVLAETIGEVCAQMGIAPRDVHTYGSSGGGYAALRMLQFLPEAAAIAVNPQTDVTKFIFKNVERYLRICLNENGPDARADALAAHPRRLSLIENIDVLRNRRIVLIQNTMDEHHYELHYKPLCSALGVGHDHDPEARPVHRLLFEHEKGHAKAETPEVFDKVMEMVVADAL